MFEQTKKYMKYRATERVREKEPKHIINCVGVLVISYTFGYKLQAQARVDLEFELLYITLCTKIVDKIDFVTVCTEYMCLSEPKLLE